MFFKGVSSTVTGLRSTWTNDEPWGFALLEGSTKKPPGICLFFRTNRTSAVS